jgi:hypothetical protein
VVYRHAVGDRRIRRATLSLNVSYEQDGALGVQIRADGGEWHTAATIRGLGAHTVQVPDTLLPARTLEVRLEGQVGVIQVDRYELQAELARPVAQPLVGRSLVLYPDWQRADWQVMPLALIRNAQGEWMLLAEVTNRTRTPARLEAFYEGDTRKYLRVSRQPVQALAAERVAHACYTAAAEAQQERRSRRLDFSASHLGRLSGVHASNTGATFWSGRITGIG